MTEIFTQSNIFKAMDDKRVIKGKYFGKKLKCQRRLMLEQRKINTIGQTEIIKTIRKNIKDRKRKRSKNRKRKKYLKPVIENRKNPCKQH